MQASCSGQPLYLDCLVPTLARISEVEYSVFAKGTHCQWHARIVSCLIATMSHFIDSQNYPEEHRQTVSFFYAD